MDKIYLSAFALQKLALCNVMTEPIEDERFDWVFFYNNVIKPHSNNVILSHYAMTMYHYGIYSRQLYDSMNTDEMQAIYKEHNKVFLEVVELRTQLVSVLEQIENNEPPQVYLTNSQGKNRELVFSTNHLQEDVLELIVNYLKNSISLFYNKYCEKDKQIGVHDISLEFLKEWEKQSDNEYSVEGVNRMGRPVSPEMLLSQICTQNLCLLLKIDSLLDSKELYAKISDVVISADDYRLIYDFLDFFGILFYETSSSITTQSDDAIKARISNFNKSSFFVKDKHKLEESILAIDEFSVDYKIKAFISKGI